MKKLMIAVLALACFAGTAAAQEGAKIDEKEVRKVVSDYFTPDLTIYYRMQFDMDASEFANRIDRAYLGFKAKPASGVSLRTTIDLQYLQLLTSKATNFGGTSQKNKYMFLKYAYGEWDFVPSLVRLVFGVQKTGLIDFENGIFKHADLDKTSLDRYSMDTSSDMGLSVEGKIPGGFGEYTVGLYSGEGYRDATPEADADKAVSARIALTPIPGMNDAKKMRVMLTPYFKLWGDSSSSDNTTLMGALASLEMPILTVGGGFFTKKVGSGDAETVLSAYGTFHLLKDGKSRMLDFFAKFDKYDSPTDSKDNTHLMFGVKYHFASKSSVALLFDSSETGTADPVKTLSMAFYQGF